MANLSDIVNELQTTNAKVERVADILQAQMKQDQAQEDAAKREKTARDEQDKRKGKGITGTISNAFKTPANGFKKVTDGFLDPLKNFFEVLLKSFVIDFFSDPEKIKMMKENLTKFGNFIKDTYKVIKDFVDLTEREGLLAAMNETFGPGGTLLAAVGVVTAIGLAVSTILAPLRVLKTGFAGIGKLLKGAALAVAGLGGMAAPKFVDVDKLKNDKLQELLKSDTGAGSTRGTGADKEFLKKDGTWARVYEQDGKTVRGAARMAMQARTDRLTGDATRFATEAAKADTGERKPNTKDTKMVKALQRLQKIMPGLALASGALGAWNIYDILDNDAIPYPEKEKLIINQLAATLGGWTGAALGGVLGAAAPIPGGALMGMIGGGYLGAEGAELLANWVMTGQIKPPKRPQNQIDTDLGFQEDFGLGTSEAAAAPLEMTVSKAPIFTPGPTPDLASPLKPATDTMLDDQYANPLSPAALEMIDKPEYHRSWDLLNKMGMGLSNDTAIRLLMSIDDTLRQYGIGGNVGVANTYNVGNQNYVLARGQVDTSDPNK